MKCLSLFLIFCLYLVGGYAKANPAYYGTISNILSYSNLSKQSVICVFNDVQISEELNQYFLKTKLAYQAMHVTATNFKNKNCQAVYFPNQSPALQNEYIKHYAKPLLSISSSNDQCEIGSIFCLSQRQQKILISINLDSLSRSKISIDPRVLKWLMEK